MSKRSNSDIRYSEMMEDLQAAFLLVTHNPKEILKSKSDLIRALQISGRNPNLRNVDKYWKAYESIGIDEFIEIGKDEHELTENELIAVFRDIDVDNNGYISHREMIDALTLTGDGMSKREAQDLIQSADVNQDNKIDYKEFARLILGTIRDAKQEAKKQTKKLVKNKQQRQRSFSREDMRRNEIMRSPSLQRRDNRNNRDNRDFSIERSPRRRESERRQRTGSRLSFKDEKEFFSDSDDMELYHHRSSPPLQQRRKTSPKPSNHQHRKESHRNNNNNNDLARSTDSLRSLMRATSLSNLDMRRMSHASTDRGHRGVKRDESKEKLNEKENKSKKFHSTSKLYEFKLEAANKASNRSAQEPKNLKKWPLKTTKGGIYINEQSKGLFSNSFVLELKSPANVHFSIQPSTTQLHSNPDLMNMDICLIVVKNGKNLSLKAITENKHNNKWMTTENLEAGTYFLFPFTSGCHLKKRALDIAKSNEKLFKSDLNGKKTLTAKFKNALNTVFDMFDLDSNGRLSRNEFNFYSIISAMEEVGDEDWDMVQNLVELNKGEMTRDGFLRLHEIEAEKEEFSLEDMYDRLFNLGFNKALEIDQSCPFAINVSCETDKFDLLLGEIYDLKSCHRFFGDIIQQKGTKKQIKGLDKVEFHEYHNYFWSILQVDNVSNRETVNLKINASKSENSMSNLNEMEDIITIKPGKSKIAMFLAPNNPNKDWTIRYDAHF